MNQRLILAAALALATPAAFCQAPAAPSTPPAAQDGPQQGPQKRHFDMRIERDGNEPMPQEMIIERHDRMGGDEGGMPPMMMHGRHEMGMAHEHGDWWKNPELAKRVGLSPEQTKKLDELSFQGKMNMIHLHAALQEQELMMKPIMESPTVDQKKADLQIDKVADARAALEKAAAKQKLAMRAVLTADQWTKLHEHPHMEGPGMMMHRNREFGPEEPQHADVEMPAVPAPPAE